MVTTRLVPVLSVIEPVSEVSNRLSAVLLPDRTRAEFSLMETLPVEVNVNVPKLVVSPPLSPNVID